VTAAVAIPDLPAEYDLAGVARLLRVSKPAVDRWVRTRTLGAYKRGGEWRVQREALAAFVRRHWNPAGAGRAGPVRPRPDPATTTPAETAGCVTTAHVARLLGVTTPTVRRWADKGLIACDRTLCGPGRRRCVIPEEALADFLHAHGLGGEALAAVRGRPVLTTLRAARLAGVSRRAVYQWVDEGRLPALRLPGGRGGKEIIRVPEGPLLALTRRRERERQ
jgi:excisionase family DNA binding protein